jgi:poly(3-hydroxybutyrate) depolymerase
MKHHRWLGLAIAAALLPAVPADAQTAGRGGSTVGYGADAVTADPTAPQTPGARGDQQRHYRFEEAKVEMPYRLYVPEDYDAGTPTPLVVALHGFTGDQNYFFTLSNDLPGKLEEHGFIFVAPMGFNRGSWYGAGGPSQFGASDNTNAIRPEGGDMSVTELGEKDVLNVIEIVKKEYNIDPDRTYLMGHSMGGSGTWYLGRKYADMWAAIGPMSGGIPVIAAVGGEETGQLAGTKAAVDEINAAGGTAVYLEIEGAGHVPMIRTAAPQVLDFFAEHGKATR